MTEQDGCAVCASLRAAMVQLAGADGFHAVTLTALAEAAGVTAAEAAVHAPPLEQLLVDAFEEQCERILAVFKRGAARGTTPAERYDNGVAEVFALYRAEPHLARVVEVEMLGAGARARRAHDAAIQRWIETGQTVLIGEDEAPPVHLEVVRGAQTKLVFDRITAGDMTFSDALRRRVTGVALALTDR